MDLVIKKHCLPVAALLSATLTWGMAAQATVIFQTDFESPAYATGVLSGQNGWNVFGNSAAVTVDSAAPITGLQSAKVTGSQIGSQTGPFHSDPSAISKVTVSADILLTSGQAERQWQFSAIGAGLAGFTGGIDIDSGTGSIFAITNGFTTIGSFSRDTVHRVELLLDYGSEVFGVKLDGATLASNLAFCGDNGPCNGALAGPYDSLIFDTFGPLGDDVGYIDNILVQSTAAVPEPTTSALLLMGLLGISSIRRKVLSRQIQQMTC